jgi:hypothetical protein
VAKTVFITGASSGIGRLDVDKGARIMANLIERGVGYSTVPRFPWNVVAPLLRVLPTSLLARSVPERERADR